MKNKILSVVFILSLVLLPSNVALAGGGGGITSIGKIFVAVVIAYYAPALLATTATTATSVGLSTFGWVAAGGKYRPRRWLRPVRRRPEQRFI